MQSLSQSRKHTSADDAESNSDIIVHTADRISEKQNHSTESMRETSMSSAPESVWWIGLMVCLTFRWKTKSIPNYSTTKNQNHLLAFHIIGMSREIQNLFFTFMQTINSEALKEREMLTRINGKNWKQFRPDNWSEMSLTEQAHWFQRQWLIPNPLVLPVSLAK